MFYLADRTKRVPVVMIETAAVLSLKENEMSNYVLGTICGWFYVLAGAMLLIIAPYLIMTKHKRRAIFLIGSIALFATGIYILS